MEKRIQADSFDHIVTNGGELTVCELVNRYVETRVSVKLSTKMGYRTVLNSLEECLDLHLSLQLMMT